MQKLLIVVIFILASTTAALAACEGQLPSNANRAINPNNPDMATFSASVRYYTNIARCNKGLNALEADPNLLQASIGLADFMAATRTMTHNSTVRGQRTLKDRMRSANVRRRVSTENIAQQFLYAIVGREISSVTQGRCKFTYADTRQPVPQHSYASLANTLVATWIASPAHNKNIMVRNLTRMESAFAIAPDETTCGIIYASQNLAG